MVCEQFAKKLSLLMDGELAPAEAAVVTGHLKNCPDCAAAYSSFEKIGQLYRTAPTPAPENFSANIVVAKVEARAVKADKMSAWRRLTAAGLIFVSGLIAGNLVGKWRKPPVTTVASTAKAEPPSPFPYRVKIPQGPDSYYIIIENEEDERQWRQFVRDCARQVRQNRTKESLHRYSIDDIPVYFIRCGDF